MRVLLVDDHVLVRQVLAGFLSRVPGVEVVGEAGDGQEAVVATRQLHPDVVLMDIRMPLGDGIEATRRIKSETPEVKVVALTVSEDPEDLVRAVRSGADGYLLKSATPEELVAGLHQAVSGETALSPRVAAVIFREFAREARSRGPAPGLDALSPREMEILRLVSRGASNKEISVSLAVSESTVRNHLHHVLGKLRLRNRVQAALFAEAHGFTGGQPPRRRQLEAL